MTAYRDTPQDLAVYKQNTPVLTAIKYGWAEWVCPREDPEQHSVRLFLRSLNAFSIALPSWMLTDIMASKLGFDGALAVALLMGIQALLFFTHELFAFSYYLYLKGKKDIDALPPV